jgi:hypothetical protein
MFVAYSGSKEARCSATLTGLATQKVEGERATSAGRLSRAEAPQVMIRKNSMSTRASGVRSDCNSGEPVAHSGPGLSRAHNSSNTRSNAEGLPTKFS